MGIVAEGMERRSESSPSSGTRYGNFDVKNGNTSGISRLDNVLGRQEVRVMDDV